MNLGFKRIMSSVLAFVMLFSSLVMVNVVSVSAAEPTTTLREFNLKAEDFFYNAKTGSSGLKVAFSPNAEAAGFSHTSTSNQQFRPTNSDLDSWGSSVPENRGASYFNNGVFRVNAADTLSFTPTYNGDVTVYAYSRNTSTKSFKLNNINKDLTYKVAEAYTGSATANQTFTIELPQNLMLLGIDYIASEGGDTPTPTTYTIKMGEKTDASLPDVTLDKSSTTTKGDKVTATWSANDKYQEGSQSITLSDSMLVDTVYTVPYSAITFTPIGREQTEDSLLPISENKTYDLLEGLTIGVGEDNIAIAENTLLAGGYFQTVDGSVIKRNDSGKTGNIPYIQTNSKGTGVIKFKTEKPFKVTIPFASTGGTNTSDIAVREAGKTDLSDYVATDSVYGTTFKDFVINNLPAGTYEIYSPCVATEQGGSNEGSVINRGARIKEVTFADPEAETTYTIQMGEDQGDYPEVTLNKYETTVKDDTVKATWDANTKYQAGSQDITLDDSMLVGTTYTIPYAKITFTEIGKPPVTGNTVYKHYVNVADATSNGDTEQTNSDVFPGAPTGTSTSNAPSDTYSIAGKDDYKFSHRTGDQNTGVTIKVPSDLSNASLYVVVKPNGTSARTLTLSADNVSSQTSESFNKWVLVTFSGLNAGTTYTLTPSDKVQYAFFALAGNGGPVEPSKATISGTVTQKTGFEDVTGYTHATYYTGNKDDNKCDDNVYISDANKTKDAPVANATVTIKSKNDNGAAVSQTVKTESDGSFKLEESDTVILEDGDYTVSAADASGKTIGTAQTVTITDGKADAVNFTYDNRITATLRTDIKDYKGEIVVSSGDSEFRLLDITYHYVNAPEGSENDIARLASVVHRVKMPAGNYNLKLVGVSTSHNNNTASTRFDVSSSNTSVAETINIKSGTNMIYLINKSSSVDTDVKAAAEAKTGTLNTAVRGTYTFAPPSSSTGDAVITYSVDGAESDLNSMMYATGAKGGTGHETQFDVHGSGSYVIFKTEERFVAKITVSSQSYILANLDGDSTIDNGKSQIPVDSRYGNISVILDPGTYILYTTATSSGYVTSIQLNYDSPFTVKKVNTANGDSLNSAKMIIGSVDGTEDLSKYSTFAIIIAKTKDALTSANITSASSTDEPENKQDISTTDTESGEDAYVPDVYSWEVHTDQLGTKSKVIIDKTTTVFKKIMNAAGSPVVENTDDTEYFYSTILNNIDSTYFAVGAAKTSDDGKWMVQDTPVEITNN